MSSVMLSLGSRKPASPHLLSEPAIIARMARAAMPESATPWEWYVGDYDRIRDTMAKVLAGEAKPLPPSSLPSAQYYAPTLGQYLVNGLTRGVW